MLYDDEADASSVASSVDLQDFTRVITVKRTAKKTSGYTVMNAVTDDETEAAFVVDQVPPRARIAPGDRVKSINGVSDVEFEDSDDANAVLESIRLVLVPKDQLEAYDEAQAQKAKRVPQSNESHSDYEEESETKEETCPCCGRKPSDVAAAFARGVPPVVGSEDQDEEQMTCTTCGYDPRGDYDEPEAQISDVKQTRDKSPRRSKKNKNSRQPINDDEEEGDEEEYEEYERNDREKKGGRSVGTRDTATDSDDYSGSSSSSENERPPKSSPRAQKSNSVPNKKKNKKRRGGDESDEDSERYEEYNRNGRKPSKKDRYDEEEESEYEEDEDSETGDRRRDRKLDPSGHRPNSNNRSDPKGKRGGRKPSKYDDTDGSEDDDSASFNEEEASDDEPFDEGYKGQNAPRGSKSNSVPNDSDEDESEEETDNRRRPRTGKKSAPRASKSNSVPNDSDESEDEEEYDEYDRKGRKNKNNKNKAKSKGRGKKDEDDSRALVPYGDDNNGDSAPEDEARDGKKKKQNKNNRRGKKADEEENHALVPYSGSSDDDASEDSPRKGKNKNKNRNYSPAANSGALVPYGKDDNEDEPRVCESCGHKNWDVERDEDGDIVCEDCGEVISEDDEEGSIANRARGADPSDGLNHCPRCGCDNPDVEPDEDGDLVCDECGEVLPKSDDDSDDDSDDEAEGQGNKPNRKSGSEEKNDEESSESEKEDDDEQLNSASNGQSQGPKSDNAPKKNEFDENGKPVANAEGKKLTPADMFRPGDVVTVTVGKSNPKQDAGLKVEERNGKYYVRKVPSGGLFAKTPVTAGDKILELNGTDSHDFKHVNQLKKVIHEEAKITVVVLKKDPDASESSASSVDYENLQEIGPDGKTQGDEIVDKDDDTVGYDGHDCGCKWCPECGE